MAAKKYTHGLPQYVCQVKRGGSVAYKYQRRVPGHLQAEMGRKMWDLSLGGDLLHAITRAQDYRDHHNLLITVLSDPAAKMATIENALNVEAARQTIESDHSPTPPDWRKTEDYMTTCAGMSTNLEVEALAVFAAAAFGDDTWVKALDLSPFFEEFKDIEPTPPPTGNIEFTIYSAIKAALDARLTELQAQRPADPLTKITARMDQYIKYKAVSEQTARGYRTRVARFTEFAGDLTLDQIDPPLLRRYRDRLLDEVGRSTVAQYFYPLKSLFKWAMKEDHVNVDPTAKIDIPRNDKTVEESRWKAFNAKEIKTVWAAVQSEWNPDGKARLSPERRAAFKMAFRVLLWTGLRPNEIFKLTQDQVETDRLHIKKTKTGAARTIPLAEPIADFHAFIHSGGFDCVAKLKAPASKMSEGFTKAIRDAGLTNDRHVLYSLKDTMLDRLEGLGASENIQRSIIGHVTGRGALRNYKTGASVADMRGYLDRVTYCDGLPQT